MATPIAGTLGNSQTLRPDAGKYYVLTAFSGEGVVFTDGSRQIALNNTWYGDRLILTRTAYVQTQNPGSFAYSGTEHNIV